MKTFKLYFTIEELESVLSGLHETDKYFRMFSLTNNLTELALRKWKVNNELMDTIETSIKSYKVITNNKGVNNYDKI